MLTFTYRGKLSMIHRVSTALLIMSNSSTLDLNVTILLVDTESI